jgi:SAM-dependent methyltransferase
MPVHEVAAEGFGSGADAYERGRPSYPPDAVAWLVESLRLRPGVRLVDLAAGTGKLTRLLAPTGAWLAAVEPVEGMRQVLHRTLPAVPALAATAEALPFGARSLDAVTVAQAFHWFEPDAAFAELARVLRPGGRVGLVWNARDRSVGWVDELWGILDRVEKRAPWRDHERPTDRDFAPQTDRDVAPQAGFGPVHEATFHHEQRIAHDAIAERFTSVSHVAVLPAAQQRAVVDEVLGVLASDPATAGRAELAIPYRVDAYWRERR